MLLPRVPWGAVFQRQDVLRGICAVLLACLCPCRSASRGSPGGFCSAAPHFTTLGFFFSLPVTLGASPPKGRVWAMAEGSWWHAAEARSSVTLRHPLGSGGSPLQPATAEHPSWHPLQPCEGLVGFHPNFFSSTMTFPSSFLGSQDAASMCGAHQQARQPLGRERSRRGFPEQRELFLIPG